MIFSLSTVTSSSGKSFIMADTIKGTMAHRQLPPHAVTRAFIDDVLGVKRFLDSEITRDSFSEILGGESFYYIGGFVVKGSDNDCLVALENLEAELSNIVPNVIEGRARVGQDYDVNRHHRLLVRMLGVVCDDGSRESQKALRAYRAAGFDCSTQFVNKHNKTCTLCFKVVQHHPSQQKTIDRFVQERDSRFGYDREDAVSRMEARFPQRFGKRGVGKFYR